MAVLKEAGLLDSKEGVSILGAAVADDVIGVILLSVMCTLVNTGSVDVAGLGLILLKQVLFFVAAAVVVVWVAPALMTLAGVLKAPSGIAVMAVIICLAMAWASNLAGLSYAVGAFFAGIAVSNSDYAEDAAYHDQVVAAMETLRLSGDAVEALLGKDYLPYPTYGDLLYGIND